MTPFAIAGVQMHVTTQNNIAAMGHRLDLLMHLYPWVQMVMFSELACFGPLLQHAQPLPGTAEEAFQEMAARQRTDFRTAKALKQFDAPVQIFSSRCCGADEDQL